MNEIPNSARYVVIGGGIGGASVAYHLAKLGARDVLLLERASLSAGTTWHSTGNMETYRADPLIYGMVRYAAELYPAIAAESGRDIGWRQVGRVMYTDREDRWSSFRSLPELGRARGIELVPLAPAEVAQRLPIIDVEGLLGGLWIPSDARVNPTDAVMALAACARARGVQVMQNVHVESLAIRDGLVRGVVTSAGTIGCETVVIASGLWSRELAAASGLSLPLYALEHQYLITKPIGIDRALPLFLSYDDQLYGREEVGGLMIGSLDDDAIPLSGSELPQNFSFALLGERWDQFTPYLETAMRRFPALREAPVRMLLNGPESFTPDGQMLLGPVPGAGGVFAACAFNSNGMALAPAAGRYVAEWILEGAPSADVAPLDVRRFSPVEATDGFLRSRVTEIPGYHCRLHSLDDDYRTARDVRRSCLHAEWERRGARFASAGGWERALWCARAPDDDLLAAVDAEVSAACASTLAIDHSADVCVHLRGAGASEWLRRLTASDAAAGDGRSSPALLPGAHGEVEALVRVLTRAPDDVLLLASPDQYGRLFEWLRRAAPPAPVAATDLTGAQAWVALHGPQRHAVADALGHGHGSGAAAECFDEPAAAVLLLALARDRAPGALARLASPSSGGGVVFGGHLAEEALRIRRGYPGFGREATPARLVTELWPAARATGGSAAPPANHAARRLTALESPLPDLGFGGREPVLCANQSVGELTSRARLASWPMTLALALLEPAVPADAPLSVVANGRRWPLQRRAAK